MYIKKNGCYYEYLCVKKWKSILFVSKKRKKTCSKLIIYNKYLALHFKNHMII